MLIERNSKQRYRVHLRIKIEKGRDVMPEVMEKQMFRVDAAAAELTCTGKTEGDGPSRLAADGCRMKMRGCGRGTS